MAQPVRLGFMGVILATSAFEAGAQISLKLAKNQGSHAWLLAGIASYVVVALCIYSAYAYKGVGLVNAVWSGMSIVLMILLGRWLFAEKLHSNEYLGVTLILAGILVINARRFLG